MEYIAHHGIKGQKWGVRRYQNPDGTLTPLGKNKKRSDAARTPASVPKPHIRRTDSISVADAGRLTPEELAELYNNGLLTEKTYREALQRIQNARVSEYNQQVESVNPLLSTLGTVGIFANFSSFANNNSYNSLVESGDAYINEAQDYLHYLDLSQTPHMSWNGEYDGMSMQYSGKRKKKVGAGANMSPGMTYRPGHKPRN